MNRYIQFVLILNLVLWLNSCGGFVRVNPSGTTTIQGGVLSSITGLAVKVTTKDGVKIAYSQTGYEGENVANNAILGFEAGKAVDGTVRTVESNNNKVIKTGQQGVQTHAIDHPITTTTQSIDQGTGTVLTNTAQKVPFPGKIK